MGATGTRNARSYVRVRPTRPAGLAHERALRAAWAVFLILGLPFLLMAVLTTLATVRIYIEPFRVLWQPWPPDALKPFLGIAAFSATLGYLAYRGGRSRGFRSGHTAGMAAARNAEEGQKATTPSESPEPVQPDQPSFVVSAATDPSKALEPPPPIPPPA